MSNLKEKEKILMEDFKGYINNIYTASYVDEPSFSVSLNLFIDGIRRYIEDNTEEFYNDYMVETLVYEYIRFINLHHVGSYMDSYKKIVSLLIDSFEEETHKGLALYFLFIKAYSMDEKGLIDEINESLEGKYKYLVDNNKIRLVDAYFVTSITFNSLATLDVKRLHRYLYNIKFYKTEESIKYSLIIIMFALTHYCFRESMFSDLTNGALFQSLDIYKDFIKTEEFLIKIRGANRNNILDKKIVKPYFIKDYKIYAVENYEIIYDVLFNESSFNDIYDHMLNNTNYKEFSIEEKYFILKGFYLNEDGLKSYFDDFLLNPLLVDSYKSKSVSYEEMLQFIKESLKSNINNKEVCFDVLELFNLNYGKLILDLYNDSSSNIKSFLMKEFKEFEDDFYMIDFLKNKS